ncbi:MAG TPA: outer membrane lipoprotein-sorting protein [Myxococcota bacterium]|nr:outer membrane lipoprotein-sorting protein [Myxococcota bacterium]HRY93090.1 outer membrane lipoprotein-sorting protein [Myxococcota bacterium]HSA20095.1 outer membrane lipoprotein-sorting protein [Myxococcota bacterium]
MRTCLWLLAAVLLLCGAARAQAPDGDALIARMDRIHTTAQDQYFEYDLVTEEAGKQPRGLSFAVTLNSKKWRHVQFLAPGDVKGMRVLTLDTSRIWLWLPAFKKVRKMASHAKATSFMGTAMSSEDGSVVTYGDLYAGRLVGEDAESWKVEGTRREGADISYARMLFELRKDIGLPSALHYFNDQGVEVKTELRQSYDCRDGLCNSRVFVITDHQRGLKTTMVRRTWRYNQGVEDAYFSVRALQRG